MGGKKVINQQEKLAKANASSSTRAAQSLGGTGFIGFSAFATAPAPVAASDIVESTTASTSSPTRSFSFYDGNDTDIALALKMLGKRDAQTKTRALLTLKDTIIPSRKPIEIRPAVGNFCYLYSKLMLDNGRRVRQLANEVLGALIDRMKKGTIFHTHMMLLLPPWYVLGMHDLHQDTANCATRAFQALFPEAANQSTVITAYLDTLFGNIKTYLEATVDSLSDRALCTADEAEERYERCITSALISFSDILNSVKIDNSNELCSTLLSMLSKFTTLTSKNSTFSRAGVRHASFQVLIAAATSAPSILEALEPKVVLGVMAEKFPANINTMWTLVLTYLQSHQSPLPWSSLQGNILPKVLVLTKHAFYGSTSSMQNLLPFLSKIPLEIVLSASTAPFYIDLLSSLWKSLDSQHVLHGQTHVVNAFTECFSAMLTIFPASALTNNLQFDSAIYTSQFEDILTLAWTKAFTNSSLLPDRAFQVFSHGMIDLVPRLAAYHERTSVNEVASHAVDLCQKSLESGLKQALVKDSTGIDSRILSTLKYSFDAYAEQPKLLSSTVQLCQRIVSYQLSQGPLNSRGLSWLGQILNLVGWSRLFPDPMAALADYQRVIAPSFASDKAAFFSVWKHYAPIAPDVLWAQLLHLWDRSDTSEWKKIALPSLSSLSVWSVQDATTTIDPIYDVVWKSHWFDTRATMMILDSTEDHEWADEEIQFFSTCWGDNKPLVSPKTIRQIVAWCHRIKTQVRSWAVLDSLLPFLIAIDSNETWGDVIDLVEAIVILIPFHSKAMALWQHAIRTSIPTWPSTYQVMLMDNWADQLKRLNNDSVACSASQWSVLCGEFLLVQGGRSWDNIPLFDDNVSYRQLECIGEICHWNNGQLLKDGYMNSLSISQLYQWIFLDVGFALTWYVVDTDPVILSQHVGTWIEPYLMLGDLLDVYGNHEILGNVLIHLVNTVQSTEETTWFSSILSSHLDHKASDTLSPPFSFKLWLIEILMDYITPNVMMNIIPNLVAFPPSILQVVLPRIVQVVEEGKEIHVLDHLIDTTMTSLMSSTFDPALISILSNLLPIMRDEQADDVLKVIRDHGRAIQSPSKVITVEEWLACVSLVSNYMDSKFFAIGTSTEVLKIAGQLLLHAFIAKQDVSEVVRLKLHSTSVRTTADLAALDPRFMMCREKLICFVQVLARHGQDHSSIELARHHREAILMVAIRTIADGIHLKPQFHTDFAASTSTVSGCWDLILQAQSVQQAFTSVVLGLDHVLMFVDDESVGSHILQVCEGRDMLWRALSETIKHQTLQAALYQVLRLTSLPVVMDNVDDLIDINGEDESVTDAALANLLLTPGLQHALQKITEPSDNPLSMLLIWDLYLRMFPESNNPLVTSALGAYVGKHNLLGPILTLCGSFIQNSKLQLTSSDAIESTFPSLGRLEEDFIGNIHTLAGAVFYRTVVRLPTMVRLWWNDDCSRSVRSWVSKFCEENVSPLLLIEEIKSIHDAGTKDLWDADEMTVRGSKVSREITTTYLKDECTLEMVIRVPSSYPLRSIEVECTKRIGISEERWRRWILQILKVTTSQDGSLLNAVLLWKSNVDKEFDGVEPCPICFSILNPKTMGLPNLQCRTCNNKYHNSCLYKWFSQSSKNKCPICQQPFC